MMSPRSFLSKRLRESASDPGSVLGSIKNTLYGNQNEKQLDQVDTILGRISKHVINKDAHNYAELMRTIMSKALSGEDYDSIPGGLVNDLDTLSRLTRYLNAEEIVDSISYCARALKVLTDGIISPDDITKQSIQVFPATQASNEDELMITNIKTIVRDMKLDKRVFDITYETLKMGDQFVEVCDYHSEDVPLTQSLLNESKESLLSEEDLVILTPQEHTCNYEWTTINENTGKPEEEAGKEFKIKLELVIETSSLNEFSNNILEGIDDDLDVDTYKDKKVSADDDISASLHKDKDISSKDDEKEKIEKRDTKLADLRIIIHNPRTVIKLQSKRHKMCIGYLVLPEFTPGTNPYFGGSNSCSGCSPSQTSSQFGLSSLMPTNAMITGVDALYRDLMAKVKKYVKEKEITINKREVLNLLTRSIKEMDFADEQFSSRTFTFKVRFVPPHRMEHFLMTSQRFFPYGEGIFYKSTFQAKLLIALETAISVKRVSDSVDKRIIYVETGLPRDARNVIEDMKNALKKRKFSLDSFGTISSIPSTITSYEDIFIPQSKGRRFVEFDTLQSNIQIREVVDELKYFRDQIVAGLDVPPSYLNLEENLSNKSALTFENSIFAQTIVSYQYLLSGHLFNLISKMYIMLYRERIKEGITITFPPPKMLQMERDAEKYDMVARIVQALSDMGVDKEWAVKKYVDLPWEDIKNTSTKHVIDQKITPPPVEDMMGGMGGMGGLGGLGGLGGMGGMPPAAGGMM